MRVGALWIYPVKSCRGLAVEHSEVTPKGLSRDREWMVVDEAGRFLTQRTHPQMTQIRVSLEADHLILSDCRDVLEPIAVPRSTTGPKREVRIWKTQTLALDEGDVVADWLTRLLDTPCRLVRQSSDYPRPTDPEYAPGGTVSFADGYPLLLTTTASLADLNRRIQASDPKADPVSMRQFRSNIVVEL
ncbi:MAG: MOSC N-terminal beta barrel domain-containing protein, partial [Wenzhouxiangella sp.]|nr:MOSC N-terminal beta barrel domain-containing protein [Wenzhouxiangella sp.]